MTNEKILIVLEKNSKLLFQTAKQPELPFSLLNLAVIKIPLINTIMYFVSKLRRTF